VSDDALVLKVKELRHEVQTLRVEKNGLILMLEQERLLRKDLEKRLSAATEKKSAELPPEFDKLFGGIFKGGK
jgi:hypothetical protein